MGIAITAKKQNMHYGTEAIKRMLECGFSKYDVTENDIFMEAVREK